MSKVLIIGSGGREHALGWKIAQSPEVSEVLYSSGNAGTYNEIKGRNIETSGSNEDLAHLIESENIDLTIIGPEQPLANGLVDFLNSRGYYKVFGPTEKAAQLESDKFFSYRIMKELKIPQADSILCKSLDEAIDAIEKTGFTVIKARGLTAGKGVTVCSTKEETLEIVEKHSEQYKDKDGNYHVLIAERLYGQEFSVFGISDGKIVSPLEISLQDHKRLLDNDKGPNTGGMGAYCPVPIASKDLVRYVANKIMTPVIQKMRSDGIEYKGFIYAGMIMTNKRLRVLEFNVRFGDPECQPAMMMINNGLYETISLALEGKLNRPKINFKPGASCCVVLASQGYPENYKKGLLISGLDEVNGIGNVKIFHAGTKLDYSNRIVTAGGRVLGVTAYSEDGIGEAQKLAYYTVQRINIDGGFYYRRDIGSKAL
ncbi:phosphoribosylamine--glycine ligase [Candidatus Woesearchaeota archaeon]|nr:phosphoribosylamine--glycine ligase [Candidatus Woesearchaeota archaeon]